MTMQHKTMRQRLAELERICGQLADRLEQLEEQPETSDAARREARRAEQAFTDGVSNILNYAVERKRR